MFNKGDKVKLRHRPNGKIVEGEVVEIDAGGPFDPRRYKIKYDGDYIPTEDWHALSELSSIDKNDDELPWGVSKVSEIKCECGAKHDRHFPNFHLNWCPLYRKDTY